MGAASQCCICADKRLAEIHAHYAANGGVNATAAHFAISKTSWKRHLAAGHCPVGAPSPPKVPTSPPPPPEPVAPPPPALVITGDYDEADDEDEDDDNDSPNPQNPDRKGRACHVCKLPEEQRRAIEADLAAGHKYSWIQEAHGVGRKSVAQHERCIARTIAKARSTESAQLLETVRARAERLMAKAEKLVTDAETTDNFRARASTLVAAKGVLEMLGKLTGEIGPDISINILGNQQWKRIEALIWEHFGTSQEFPAFVEALAAIDDAQPRLALTR